MAFPFALIPFAIQAGQGIYNAITGGSKARKARRAQEELLKNRPQRQIPQGELDMLSLLGNRANQGLSDATINQYGQRAERGLTSRLDAIIKSGGNANGVGDAYQDYLSGLSALSLADDRAQLQNIDSYLQQNRRISDYQDRQYEENVFAPWADKLAAASQERALAESRQQSGIGQIAGGIAGYGSHLGQKSDENNLLGLGTNWLGQSVNRNSSGGNTPNATMTNQQFGNTFTGAAMGLNNNYFTSNPQTYRPSWAPLMAGYNTSNMRPSDRESLMYILGDQFA